MAIDCNGSGKIDLQTIVNAVNSNEDAILNQKLDDHIDVDATNPSDGNVIVFDAVQNKWIAKAAQGGQIQSDWNQTDSGAIDFIKNKPNLDIYEKDLGVPTTNGDVLVSDTAGNRQWLTADSIFGIDLSYESSPTYGRIVNDSGDNATIPAATESVAGLMSASDKTSLDYLIDHVDGGIY